MHRREPDPVGQQLIHCSSGFSRVVDDVFVRTAHGMDCALSSAYDEHLITWTRQLAKLRTVGSSHRRRPAAVPATRTATNPNDRTLRAPTGARLQAPCSTVSATSRLTSVSYLSSQARQGSLPRSTASTKLVSSSVAASAPRGLESGAPTEAADGTKPRTVAPDVQGGVGLRANTDRVARSARLSRGDGQLPFPFPPTKANTDANTNANTDAKAAGSGEAEMKKGVGAAVSQFRSEDGSGSRLAGRRTCRSPTKPGAGINGQQAATNGTKVQSDSVPSVPPRTSASGLAIPGTSRSVKNEADGSARGAQGSQGANVTAHKSAMSDQRQASGVSGGDRATSLRDRRSPTSRLSPARASCGSRLSSPSKALERPGSGGDSRSARSEGRGVVSTIRTRSPGSPPVRKSLDKVAIGRPSRTTPTRSSSIPQSGIADGGRNSMDSTVKTSASSISIDSEESAPSPITRRSFSNLEALRKRRSSGAREGAGYAKDSSDASEARSTRRSAPEVLRVTRGDTPPARPSSLMADKRTSTGGPARATATPESSLQGADEVNSSRAENVPSRRAEQMSKDRTMPAAEGRSLAYQSRLSRAHVQHQEQRESEAASKEPEVTSDGERQPAGRECATQASPESVSPSDEERTSSISETLRPPVSDPEHARNREGVSQDEEARPVALGVASGDGEQGSGPDIRGVYEGTMSEVGLEAELATHAHPSQHVKATSDARMSSPAATSQLPHVPQDEGAPESSKLQGAPETPLYPETANSEAHSEQPHDETVARDEHSSSGLASLPLDSAGVVPSTHQPPESVGEESQDGTTAHVAKEGCAHPASSHARQGAESRESEGRCALPVFKAKETQTCPWGGRSSPEPERRSNVLPGTLVHIRDRTSAEPRTSKDGMRRLSSVGLSLLAGSSLAKAKGAVGNASGEESTSEESDGFSDSESDSSSSGSDSSDVEGDGDSGTETDSNSESERCSEEDEEGGECTFGSGGDEEGPQEASWESEGTSGTR